MAEREKLIELKDLQITFGSGKKKFVAVDHVNFDIYKGETFSLVGESGSGKTTIGRAICRINPTSGGDIFFKGQKINGKISKELDREVIRKVQMIFQDPMASLNERAKVEYIVAEGLLNHHLYKDQDDLPVDLPQAVGRLHAVDARQLNVHCSSSLGLSSTIAQRSIRFSPSQKLFGISIAQSVKIGNNCPCTQ